MKITRAAQGLDVIAAGAAVWSDQSDAQMQVRLTAAQGSLCHVPNVGPL